MAVFVIACKALLLSTSACLREQGSRSLSSWTETPRGKSGIVVAGLFVAIMLGVSWGGAASVVTLVARFLRCERKATQKSCWS